MSTRKYTFITPTDSSQYGAPKLPPMRYYQICGFANPRKLKYEVRLINIDENNDIANYKVYLLTKSEHSKLLKTLRDNVYRLYATYSLDYVELPNCNDLAVARSDMICNDSYYSGFASVK